MAIVSAKSLGGAYEDTFGVRMPPLSAACLAGVAKEKGFEAKFFDASSKKGKLDSFFSEIYDYDPDVIGFILNASSFSKPSIELAKKLRGLSSVIVAGGHHATFSYSSVLRNGFDVVFLGEGERTFGEFLDKLKKGEDWKDIRGLAYIEGEKVTSNGLPETVEKLDELPMPAFEVYEKENYKMKLLDPEESIMTVETSRGCPYNCEYCSVTKMWGAKWRLKSAERVINELKKVKELSYKWVFFVDDNFIIPVKSIISERVDMLQRMIKEGLNSLRYIVQLRADFVAKNEWLPPLLYDAGVRVAFLGIESGDPETLRSMRKNLIPEQSAKAVQLLSSNGIIVHGGFILGAPYESKEAMKRTIRFAEGLIGYGLDSAQFSIYTPLPGTDAFMRAASKGDLLTLNWDLYDVLHPVMRTNISPAKLFLIQRWASYRFFIEKGIYSLKKGSFFSPPRTEKEKFLNTGKKFLMKKIPSYVIGLMKLPFSALSIYAKLRKGLSEEERIEVREIVNDTISILPKPQKLTERLPIVSKGK